VHRIKFVTGDKYLARIQLYNATLIILNQLCTWTAKTHAIPSLHRDSFSAKVPGPCPVLSSGNTTSLYCRAVSCKANYTMPSLYLDFQRASKSFAAHPCNRPVAAKYMLFCLPGLRSLDNFIIT
jgi:hypothetical protein